MAIVERKIDKLGRIVLPMNFRKALGLLADAKVAINVEGSTITVKSADTVCKICGRKTKSSNTISVCPCCVKKIKGVDN